MGRGRWAREVVVQTRWDAWTDRCGAGSSCRREWWTRNGCCVGAVVALEDRNKVGTRMVEPRRRLHGGVEWGKGLPMRWRVPPDGAWRSKHAYISFTLVQTPSLPSWQTPPFLYPTTPSREFLLDVRMPGPPLPFLLISPMETRFQLENLDRDAFGSDRSKPPLSSPSWRSNRLPFDEDGWTCIGASLLAWTRACLAARRERRSRRWKR